MRQRKMLLLAAVVLCLASPALAGTQSPWNPWAKAWVCSAFEYVKKCNAELNPRSRHCECIGDGYMGWRLEEYYGRKARNLAPRDEGP